MENDRINYSIYEESEIAEMLSDTGVNEFNVLNYDGESFVNACYHWLFDRDPDKSGMASNIELLKKGIPKKAIIYKLTMSEEFTNRIVISRLEEFKKSYLRCEFDVSGLLGIRDKADFIDAAYKMILNRKPDMEGYYNHLLSLLNGGAKESIIYILAVSEEGRNTITIANLEFYHGIFERYQKHTLLRKIKRLLLSRRRMEDKINECYLSMSINKHIN